MRNTGMAVAIAAVLAFSPSSRAAQSDRGVLNNTVISQRDPAVKIKLPSSVHYVGTDRFLLSDPKLGNVESCELFAFANSGDDHCIRKYFWVQFESYLPGHPYLHMTYDSPQHTNIDGLDFYVDAGVAFATNSPKPGSDGAHFYSLLASHGYRRGDLMWVRLVHLLDAAKRKELMIIYAEALAPTGYTAANLKEGGAEHAKWGGIADGLIRRAERSITIGRSHIFHTTRTP